MVSPEDIVLAASLRWRSPEKPPLRFEETDRVVIARIGDGMTSRALIGHVGVITSFLDEPLSGGEFAWSELAVEVTCATCGGVHTMSQHELDLLGNDVSLDVQEKAGITRPDAQPNELDTQIVLTMHRAGFVQVAVDDKPVPAGDPTVSRRAWSKFVYAECPKLIDLKVYNVALMAVARAVGGVLVEWHVKGRGQKGYTQLVSTRDLNTCMVGVPFRALIEAQPVL